MERKTLSAQERKINKHPKKAKVKSPKTREISRPKYARKAIDNYGNRRNTEADVRNQR